MKKIIYATAILISFLASNTVHSQTENKCYSLQKNSNGEVEMVLVKLVIQGNKVSADYIKDIVGSGNSVHVSMSKQGVIDGNKIIFDTEGTKGSGTETTKKDIWLFKDGSLIVAEDILKPGGCN